MADPTITSATIPTTGDKIVIQFTDYIGGAQGFTVKVNGTVRAATWIVDTYTKAVGTLASVIYSTDVVTYSYATGGTVKTYAGVELVPFNNAALTNNSTQAGGTGGPGGGGGSGVPVTSPGLGYAFLVFDPNGRRRSLGEDATGAATWGKELMGGFAEFSATLNAEPDALTSIGPRDRVEVWQAGRRLYRGYVQERRRELSVLGRLPLRGNGLMANLDKLYCDTTYPAGGDLRTIVKDVLRRYVRGVLPSAHLRPLYQAGPVGVHIGRCDARGKSVAAVLTELCELASADAAGPWVWGFEVNDDGATETEVGLPVVFAPGCDALYLRRVGARRSVCVFSAPGREVVSAAGGEDASQIVNRLRLTGGEMQPYRRNLLPNADFERLVEPDATTQDGLAAGNLIENAGFEIGSTHSGGTQSWTLENNASVKQNGGTAWSIIAFQGEWCLELSDNTETAKQTVTGLLGGRRYRLLYALRPSMGLNNVNGSVQIEWKNASGTVLRTDTHSGFCYQAAWNAFEAEYVAPANTASAVVHLLCGTGGAVVYDAAQLVDLDAPGQDSWEVLSKGTATVAVDWAGQDAKNGAYCPVITVTGADTSGNNEIVLRPLKPIPVDASRSYYFCVWAKMAPFATTHAGVIRLRWKESNNSDRGDPTEQSFSGTGLGTWASANIFGTAPSGAVSVWPELVMRANGVWQWDALTLMEQRGLRELLIDVPGTFGFEVATLRAPGADGVPYVPDGNLQIVFDAADVVDAATDADVHNSAAIWGLRVGAESAETITTREQAGQFALSYFLSRGKSKRQATAGVVVGENGHDGDVWPGDKGRLAGEKGQALAGGETLTVMRVSGAADGNGLVTLTTELGTKLETDLSLMYRAVREEIGAVR